MQMDKIDADLWDFFFNKKDCSGNVGMRSIPSELRREGVGGTPGWTR